MQIAALPALTQQRDILRQQLATAEAKNHQLAAQLAALAAAAGAQPTLATGSAAGDGAAKKSRKDRAVYAKASDKRCRCAGGA